jgi:cell shape-determining protein MreC
MNYRLRDSTKSSKHKTWRLAAAVAVFAVLIAVRIFAPSFSTQVIHTILSPFMRGGSIVSQKSAVSEGLVKSKQELLSENDELRRELADATVKLAVSQDLEKENGELRDLLGLTKQSKETPALVISKPPLSPYDSLVIEIGDHAAIAAGDRVYADGDILLGEVSEVSGTSATVKLYSTASNEVDTVIERNNIPQKVQGAGGGNFEFKAPKEVDVAVGDVLIIPDINRKVLGVVQQIDSQPTDSFQNVLVKSPVNIFQLKWVTIEEKK